MPETTFEVLEDEMYAGAVTIKNVDPYGKVTEIWLPREVANALATAIVTQRLK